MGTPELGTLGPGKNVEETWVSVCERVCVCVLRLGVSDAGVCARA